MSFFFFNTVQMPAFSDISKFSKIPAFFVCPDKLKGSLHFSDKAKFSLSATGSAVIIIV